MKQSNQSSESHVKTDRSARRFSQLPDTEGLGSMHFPNEEVIGIVAHVNGSGAREHSGFNPTQFEMEQLAKMWMRTLFDIDFYCFTTQSCSSSEWRECKYAERRIFRLQQHLGPVVVERLTVEVIEELSGRFKNCDWQQYLAQRN